MTANLSALIEEKHRSRLVAYRSEPADIRDHANREEEIIIGGNANRQVLELVQNGADAILDANEPTTSAQSGGRIEVVISARYLYAANTGAPLSAEGVEALLLGNSSPKRGNDIGRFGIGFKSLLRLGGALEIFSSNGSIHFDPERCRREIRQEFNLPDNAPAPGLRLAWPVDRAAAEKEDVALAEFSWATTVVRAEIHGPDIHTFMQAELDQFPAQFVLFLPTGIRLGLRSGNGTDTIRQLKQETEAGCMLLHEGSNAPSRWRVFDTQVSMEPSLKADAGSIHYREKVPLSWAVPLDRKHEEAGRFWAFFPTDTPSRLPGILNAPWKIDEGRKNLLAGAWNTAMMQAAADLIVNSLPTLSTSDDPGRVLDAFPRQLDRQDEIAAPLVTEVWSRLKGAAIIPDAQGTLRRGTELLRPPLDDETSHEQWCKLASSAACMRWVHPTCLHGKRSERLNDFSRRIQPVNRLQSVLKRDPAEPGLDRANAAAWFGEVASTDPAIAKGVLRLAENFAKAHGDQWNYDKSSSLAIIPTESGRLCKPSEVVLGPSVPGKESVLAALAEDDEAARILLDIIGVVSLDAEGWRRLLDEALKAGKWENLWSTLRQAPAEVRDRFIEMRRSEIRILRRDGQWGQHDAVLLPGRIVQPDDPKPTNLGVLLDDSAEIEMAKQVGVSDCPQGRWGPGEYDAMVDKGNRKLLRDWLNTEDKKYRAAHPDKRPDQGYLKPLRLAMPKGWMLLERLLDHANAALTRSLLEQLPSLAEVPFGHSTRPDAYPKIKVPHPLRWYLKQHGTVAIGPSVLPLQVVLACRNRKVLERIPSWNETEILLKSLLDEDAVAEGAEDLRRFWHAIFACLVTPEAIEGDTLRDVWTEAARDKQVPKCLRTAAGEISLSEVYVTGSASFAQRARTQGKTVVTLEAEAKALWLENGAQALDNLLRSEWLEIVSEHDLLVNALPDLAEFLNDIANSTARSQNVRGLRLSIEGTGEPVPCLQADGVLYLDPDQMQPMSRAEQMRVVLNEIAAAGWLNVTLEKAASGIANSRLDERRAWVAAGATLEERLLRAVGERSDPLRASIGEAAKAIPQDCLPLDLARLALALHGPAVLQKLRDAIESEELQPPGSWGSDKARAFVAEIGFPEDFAVSSEAKREAEIFMTGPIPLGSLHDYQEEVIEGLDSLLKSGSGRRRAVVSLPTGAGKTRVAVQAAVDLVLKPVEGTRSVLWVAQTDELCEQAVQAFRQVWLSFGTEGSDLRIVRFWRGNPTPAAPEKHQPTVVVATIQTLGSRMVNERLEWLNKPGLVVLDECHHAITPSYTGLLRWLNADHWPGTAPRDEPPIIGLSATPFRANEEESERLAKRFGKHLLPQNQERLYEQLTERKVLAEPIHETLPSSATPPQELLDLLELEGDAIASENQLEELNRWLAGDKDRNRILIEAIQSSTEQRILFFANSVAHANEMAVRLNLCGISAAPISGDTASSARRHFLKQFQEGEIRVLCNHSVLTTGFDAPKTDMVLVSRIVRSQALCMQMVGRGLRGTANGGTEKCRIVTVRDNLERFSNLSPNYQVAKYYEEVRRRK
jgi:superfamily II DNA or RNA helicase